MRDPPNPKHLKQLAEQEPHRGEYKTCQIIQNILFWRQENCTFLHTSVILVFSEPKVYFVLGLRKSLPFFVDRASHYPFQRWTQLAYPQSPYLEMACRPRRRKKMWSSSCSWRFDKKEKAKKFSYHLVACPNILLWWHSLVSLKCKYGHWPLVRLKIKTIFMS